MRNAASWPFHALDCHIRNHSPPIVRKATSHVTKPEVSPAMATPKARRNKAVSAQRAKHPKRPPPAKRHRENLPDDDGEIEKRMPHRRMQGTPHSAVVQESRIHQQNMAHELKVRTVICQSEGHFVPGGAKVLK